MGGKRDLEPSLAAYEASNTKGTELESKPTIMPIVQGDSRRYTIRGTGGDDQLMVDRAADGTYAVAINDRIVARLSAEEMRRTTIDGGGGDDRYYVSRDVDVPVHLRDAQGDNTVENFSPSAEGEVAGKSVGAHPLRPTADSAMSARARHAADPGAARLRERAGAALDDRGPVSRARLEGNDPPANAADVQRAEALLQGARLFSREPAGMSFGGPTRDGVQATLLFDPTGKTNLAALTSQQLSPSPEGPLVHRAELSNPFGRPDQRTLSIIDPSGRETRFAPSDPAFRILAPLFEALSAQEPMVSFNH